MEVRAYPAAVAISALRNDSFDCCTSKSFDLDELAGIPEALLT